MMQATQNGEREDLAICVICWGRPSWRLWNLLPDALMWPGLVEVERIRIEHSVKLLLMEDKQVIETFATHTPEKALTDGIGSWSVIRCCENLDATRVCNPSEVHPKLAIIIPDEVFRSLSVGRGFTQLMRYPGVGRRSCDAHMDHFARVQFDDEEGLPASERRGR